MSRPKGSKNKPKIDPASCIPKPNNSPLLEVKDQDTLALEKLQTEVMDTENGILSAFNGEIKSPSELKKMQKELLDSRRKQIQFLIDGKKLNQTLQVMSSMELITDILTDEEVMLRVKDNVKTGMDIKMLADAYGKFADKLQTLSRIDTLDGEGTAKRLNLAVDWKNSDGTSTKVVIQSE